LNTYFISLFQVSIITSICNLITFFIFLLQAQMQQVIQGNSNINTANKGANIIKLVTSTGGSMLGGKATILGTNQQGHTILGMPGGNVVSMNKQVLGGGQPRQQPTWVLAKSGTQVMTRPAGGSPYVIVTQASSFRNLQGNTITTSMAGTSVVQSAGKT
jgi:hypothetical protein